MPLNNQQEMLIKYKRALERYGDSVKSLMWSNSKYENRFKVLSSDFKDKSNFTVLDYGCGLAHLKNFFEVNGYTDYKYTGVDIFDEFIELSKNKYPDAKFEHISSYKEIKLNYDYILISGVFNILFKNNEHSQFEYIQDTLRHLYDKTDVYLAVNFMNKDVDFINEGSYHQDVLQVYSFVINNLSKRVILDQSYMPYEFTIKIFKNIEKIENVYKDALDGSY